jgi:hypothetical protein
MSKEFKASIVMTSVVLIGHVSTDWNVSFLKTNAYVVLNERGLFTLTDETRTRFTQ